MGDGSREQWERKQQQLQVMEGAPLGESSLPNMIPLEVVIEAMWEASEAEMEDGVIEDILRDAIEKWRA